MHSEQQGPAPLGVAVVVRGFGFDHRRKDRGTLPGEPYCRPSSAQTHEGRPSVLAVYQRVHAIDPWVTEATRRNWQEQSFSHIE